MSFKFTADLGWLKVEGETETAADFVSAVSTLDALGHTADRQEVIEWLRTIPEEGWFWEGLNDMFELKAMPFIAGIASRGGPQIEAPLENLNLSNSAPLVEPSEPFAIPVREGELAEGLDVIDLAANPVVDAETPPEILDDQDINVHLREHIDEWLSEVLTVPETDSENSVEPPHGTLVPVVDQMAEAANRTQAPDERVALKSEFRDIFDNEVLGVKSLEKTGMVKVGWLGNRLYGKCWPTKDDIELLKRMIAKAHEPVCDPPRAEPEPTVALNPDAKLRRITFTPEAALRLCDLLSDGLSDAVASLRMNGEFMFDGSPLTISDIAEFRKLRKGDIGALETGRALSFGNYRSVRADIERVLKAQGEIVVEYQKKEAV